LLVLLLLACASPLWADTPDLISRRALALVGKSLFGVALATRYTFEDQLKMFRVAFRVGALLTFVLIAISPARALSGADGGGGIRGVFPHKNILGGVMALALRWDHDDLEALPKTLRWVQSLGTEVVLFGPIVQYDSALPRLLAMSIRSNDATIPALHRVAYYERLDADMSKLAQADPGVRYISYFKILCRQSACLEYAGAGVRLQSDYGHLTSGGSVLVATKIRETGGLN
jgi:hypothetical protein